MRHDIIKTPFSNKKNLDGFLRSLGGRREIDAGGSTEKFASIPTAVFKLSSKSSRGCRICIPHTPPPHTHTHPTAGRGLTEALFLHPFRLGQVCRSWLQSWTQLRWQRDDRLTRPHVRQAESAKCRQMQMNYLKIVT